MITVKAILCDIDGTLLDSNAQHAEAWQRAFAHFGIETTFDEVVHQIGKGGENLIPVFVPEADRERLQKPLEKFRTDLFRREYLPNLRPFPGARDLLIKIKQAGIRIAVASSSNKQDLENFKRILNIEDLVEKDTSADDAERSKPAPDIFEAALERVHLHPHEVLALGDTPWDIEAANKAHVKTIAVTSGGWSREDLEQAGALEVYADVAEITARFASSAFVAKHQVPNGASFVTRLNPSTMLDATAIGNSQISVAEAGRLAFVAGQTATRRDGGPLPHDLASQSRMVATQLAAALHELGASARDVITFRMYVVDATPERFKEAWFPIHEMLDGEMPSATAIGVQALWTTELQIEVEMTVRVP